MRIKLTFIKYFAKYKGQIDILPYLLCASHMRKTVSLNAADYSFFGSEDVRRWFHLLAVRGPYQPSVLILDTSLLPSPYFPDNYKNKIFHL